MQLGGSPTQMDYPQPAMSASQTPSASQAPRGLPASMSETVPSPSLHRDRTLPTPVRNLRLGGNTAQTYTLTWRPSQDAAGIRHYVVLANGFLVGRTRIPTITLVWQTTTDNILVQVAPVDGNGLQGEWRALMIVPPPLPAPNTTGSAPSTFPQRPTTSSQPPSSGQTSTQRTSPSVSERPSASTSPSGNPTGTTPSMPTTAQSCSTQDVTPTATATTSQQASASPAAPQTALSPSAQPATASPTTSLSSEPGSAPSVSPSNLPDC